MAEVPDHLAPKDGISRYSIRLAGMDTPARGTVIFRFDVIEGSDNRVATLSFPTNEGTSGLTEIFARGHQELVNALRQMLHHASILKGAYE